MLLMCFALLKVTTINYILSFSLNHDSNCPNFNVAYEMLDIKNCDF